MKPTYSVSHLAKELGLDRRTLDARLEGVPFEAGAKNSKEYTLRAVLDAFITHAEGDASSKKKPRTDEERIEKEALLLDTKLKSAMVQLESDEIDLEKKKGNLIEADRVDEIIASPLLAMRSHLIALPRRASMDGAMKPQRELERVLEKLIDSALKELVIKLKKDLEDPNEGADQG